VNHIDKTRVGRFIRPAEEYVKEDQSWLAAIDITQQFGPYPPRPGPLAELRRERAVAGVVDIDNDDVVVAAFIRGLPRANVRASVFQPCQIAAKVEESENYDESSGENEYSSPESFTRVRAVRKGLLCEDRSVKTRIQSLTAGAQSGHDGLQVLDTRFKTRVRRLQLAEHLLVFRVPGGVAHGGQELHQTCR
jgi:hypothetical protein